MAKAKAIVSAIQKRDNDCRKTFKNKKPTRTKIEGTLLIMIAAGLIDYAIMCDKEDDGIVVLELATQPGRLAIHDDNAWNVIPSCYFCK